MLGNSPFTFSTYKGTYEIRRGFECRSKYRVPSGEEGEIVANYEYGINEVYVHEFYTHDSVALKFSRINIFDDGEIIGFCNKYGLLHSEKVASRDNFDYAFLHIEKKEYVPFIEREGIAYLPESMSLFEFRRAVIELRNTLAMQIAINNEDFLTIIKILVFMCFDSTTFDPAIDYDKLEEIEITKNQEVLRFNQAYMNYLIDKKEAEVDYFTVNEAAGERPLSKMKVNERIKEFLELLDYEFQVYQLDEPMIRPATYYSHLLPDKCDTGHASWLIMHDIFTRLLERCSIENIGCYGEITLSNDLSEDDISYIIQKKEYILVLAKVALANWYESKLQFVSHTMTITRDGKLMPDLNFPSLETAMYLELFYSESDYSRFRCCMNPNCNTIFEVTRENSKKLYCSTRCAQLMAKRKQRERERNQKSKNNKKVYSRKQDNA